MIVFLAIAAIGFVAWTALQGQASATSSTTPAGLGLSTTPGTSTAGVTVNVSGITQAQFVAAVSRPYTVGGVSVTSPISAGQSVAGIWLPATSIASVRGVTLVPPNLGTPLDLPTTGFAATSALSQAQVYAMLQAAGLTTATVDGFQVLGAS
jgi:hypothetical protein